MSSPPTSPQNTGDNVSPVSVQNGSSWQLPPAAEILVRARRAMTGGHTPEGERLYRLLLAAERTRLQDNDAMLQTARAELAAILFTTARPKEALELLENNGGEAQSVAGATLLAEARRTAGLARDALALARKCANAQPDDVVAQLVLGRVYLDLRQHRNAATAFSRALDLDPNRVDALGGLARAYCALNDVSAAERTLTEALARMPDEPDATRAQAALLARRGDQQGAASASLGAARKLFSQGRHRESREAFEVALSLAPKAAGYFGEAGTCACLQKRYTEGIALLERAVTLQPNLRRALSNLGVALMETWAFEASEKRLREALAYDPNDSEALINLANLLQLLRRHAEAEALYLQARQLSPDSQMLRFGLGLCYLAQGRFIEAQAHYDFRPANVIAANFGLPLWRGEVVPAGSSLIVMCEQGFGDTLQFMPAVKAAHTHFARIGFVCQPAVSRLAQALLPEVEVMTTLPADLSAADRYVNLLSLAVLVAPEGEILTPAKPWRAWINVEANAHSAWAQRLNTRLAKNADAPPSAPRIGICWGGGGDSGIDTLRSIPLNEFQPILERQDLHWVSLQLGAKRGEIAVTRTARRLIDLTENIGDFADTAALIAQLDLVITVDTSVAHVAGAMGKMVRMLNLYSSEWRWGIDQENCAFYPSMRIFNQPRHHDWASVIADVASALEVKFPRSQT